MRIAVTDDEKIFRDKLCAEIDGFYKSIDVICTGFDNGEALIAAYESGSRFDAVFLDIEMTGLNGMETAKAIRLFSESVPVLFITSHTEYAMDGYEVGAFRFLPKTYTQEKLNAVLNDLRNRLYKRNTILLKQDGSEYIVAAEDIVFVEADNNHVLFHLDQEKYSVRMKLTDALEMLTRECPFFVRVHRCCIVNLCHVRNYSDKEIRLDDNSAVPLSDSYALNFKSRIFDYVKKSAE